MIYIGNHLSSASGFEAMGRKALELGGDTFAFFTRNPRGGKAKALDPEDAERLIGIIKEHHFGLLVAHAPYTMNLCSAKPSVREFAANTLKDDLQRMEAVPGSLYNFHPGSHTGQGAETGIELIAAALNDALSTDGSTTVLLETMAGKGTEIGRSFEELKAILDRIEHRERMGVCLDTCHIWDAGYDIVHNLDGVLAEFDEVIGLDSLKAVHINDSLNDCGTRKDRHARIGLGKIGEDALRNVVQHPLLQGRPFILETPNDDEGYAVEIALIRSWMQ